MKNTLLFVIFFSFLNTGDFSGLHSGYIKYLNKIPENTLSDFYFKGDTKRKIVALSFDDGPFPNGAKLISYLKKEKIPATFFLVAGNITESNIKNYRTDLFTIGLHTYDHKDFRKLSYSQKENDFKKSLQVSSRHNLRIKYFRPAYGIIDSDINSLLKKNKLKGIIWSIDSQDWNGFKGQKLVNNIEKNLTGGDIILFHEALSVNDLEAVVKMLKRKGYQIVSLEEILKYRNVYPK